MTNSVEDILNAMQGRPMTYGWGAIAAFSRTRLNRMLEDEFTNRLGSARLLPPISGELFLNNPGSVTLAFNSLLFGPPRLSFQSSTISGSTATLQLEIVAGDYAINDHPMDYVPMLVSSGRVAEGMGFKLEMEIDLLPVVGAVNGNGRISLDLDTVENPRCNLVPEEPSQRLLGQFLFDKIKEQPAFRHNWQLGLLDLTTTGPLSPTHFAIRTQAHPTSMLADTEDKEDGAVLFFIALKGLQGETTSIPTALPYLIADDHSATLILNKQLIDFADDTQLNALKSLVLPRGHGFVDQHRGEPYDLAIFGDLVLTSENVKIEPLLTSVKNAQSKQFTARRGDGSAVAGVTWEASCLTIPTASGSINATGSYRAVQDSVLGSNVLPTVVTARYMEEGNERTTSALVFARFESISVAPIAATRPVGGVPLSLAASSIGGGQLSWRLVAPAYGTLEQIDHNHVLYTPPENLGGEPLVVQRIEVRDTQTGEAVEASVVLIGERLYVSVTPPNMASILGRGDIPFEVPENFAPHCKWRVLGDGQVDEDSGVFSPPLALSTSPVSVVVCDVQVGPVTVRGFAIVELAERKQVINSWTGLQEFSITALGPPQSYANGMQQIPIEIKIETLLGTDGEPHVPISDIELASLRLVEKTSNTLITVLEEHEEGIESAGTVQWAMRDRPNRFRLFGGATAHASSGAKNSGTRYRKLFIHLAHRGDPVEFYAQFQDQYGATWRSLENGSEEKSTIQVQGRAIPAAQHDHYSFVRERVWNNLETGRIEQDQFGKLDEFSYMLESTDFWRATYKRDGLYSTSFATLRIEENTSTIQWESELLKETFFSYTGYAFHPVSHPPQLALPAELSFDPYFLSLTRSVSHAAPNPDLYNYPPSPGELIVSVHRVADMAFWYDAQAGDDRHKLYRQMLDKPVFYILRDEDGNLHRLQIGFLENKVEDSRNTVKINVQ